MTRAERVARLRAELDRRVLVLDGAMGTALQDLSLAAQDFGGAELEGCNESLNLTRPDVVRGVHRGYLEAGADVLETNTFGGTPLVLAEYGLSDKAVEINRAAGRLARAEADAFWTEDRPRFVAGSMGPTTKAISVMGGVTFDQLIDHYEAQARGLHEGGVDYFLLETSQDTRNVKAGLIGIDRFQETLPPEERLPIAVSGTIEAMGTMLAGQSVDALAISLEHRDLLYLGLNCATGPEFMTDHIRTLAELARTRVACVPNAGLPDENGRYLETPEMLARTLLRFGENGWLNLLGGCCGTHRGHIEKLAEIAPRLAPRAIPTRRRSALSGVDPLEIGDEVRPVIVGERTNVLGSKKFRDLVAQEKWEEAAEIARAQVKRGAHLVDVSTQQTDRDEVADLRGFLEVLIKKIRVPLMIDSTNEKAVETGLTYSQGKAIINSVNLEDGEKRFEKIVPLARRYGAALVVGCIDERGQAIKAADKLSVARRSHELLTRKYGLAEQDLYFDPLVFPCASGDAAYTGSAVETIEAVRAIKAALPSCKTVLGISNVSFGLPAAGREVVNSVFLYHCVQAGLDLALVNAEKLERYPSIPEHERKLAEGVLFCREQSALQPAIAAFAAHFREKKPEGPARSSLPLDERLARYIVEGSRDGLFDDLAEKLRQGAKPLDVINGPLMLGMDEVGRLFNANQLIVAEVLQSAESMKAAVSFLEPHMDKVSSAARGKVLLATVKGDVHDIGKNLVDIILSNNGFEVVNLGIKVPPEALIQAVREHRPDVVGLSGLLVKSAQQMVATATDLKAAGVELPLLVGGAALSRNFVDRQIAPAYGGTVAYAQDAMSGLDLAKRVTQTDKHEFLRKELQERRTQLAAVDSARPAPVRPSAARRSRKVAPLKEVPRPPDLDRHALTNTPLDHIWRFINPVMIYGRHMGLKSSVVKDVEAGNRAELEKSEAGRKALQLKAALDDLKAECRAGAMQARAVYQFFRARGEGDDLVLLDPRGAELFRFTFPRQEGADGLCLSDYVGADDAVALFLTTAGAGIRARAEAYKKNGDFLKSHLLQALALETAEGYAELLHANLRSQWGFPDPLEMTMIDRFKASYHGKRYSFGYPACPRLEDQQILFRALRPEEIGVELTDGCMMDPEASVSAVVFHHPDATYFSVAGGTGC
jgi:5-methyltetrahydrofolate--homocysteine methyltransferase